MCFGVIRLSVAERGETTRMTRRNRVWLGIHHGAIRHLDAYLDEFVFRFNRRTSKKRGVLFYRLLEGALATDPAPFRDIVDRTT